MHCLVQPDPCPALLYFACSALSCSALHWSVLFCFVLLCSCIVLFYSAFVRIMKKKKWSRMYHIDSKSISEYVPLVWNQSQPTQSQRHSEYNSNGPRPISSSTDSKSVSEYVPLIPDQSQPTRSQRHSMVQLLPLVPDQYHWSQINGGHPSVGSMVVTTMRPSVLLWSLTSFTCSLIRWEVLPMSPRLHG